jgi:hypothetical protein
MSFKDARSGRGDDKGDAKEYLRAAWHIPRDDKDKNLTI